jgi:hypothetical protein
MFATGASWPGVQPPSNTQAHKRIEIDFNMHPPIWKLRV